MTAIDAIGKASDELYENIKKGATFPQRQWFDGMAQAQSILENLPSAQPDIIHCGECKHRDPEDKKCDCGHDILWQLPRDDKWYCADAERKDDGENISE